MKTLEKAVVKDFNDRKKNAIGIIKNMEKFPELDITSEDEILKFINTIFPMDTSTKSTQKSDLWVDPSVYLEFKFKEDEKQKLDPEYKPTIKCAWIRGRGCHAGKVCFETIPSSFKNYAGNIYDARCSDCQRNNKEKANKINAEKFEEVLNGTEVKGSPTNFNSVTVNQLPAASITGISDDSPLSPITKDPPSEFLKGNDTGDPSPSKAKKKKSSPRTKKLKLGVIKKVKLEENFKYYRSKETIEGDTWIVSQNTETDKYNIIGKFEGEKDEFSTEDFENLSELTEEDLIEAKTYKLDYEYYSKKSSEDEKLSTTSFSNPEAGGKGDISDEEMYPEAGGKGDLSDDNSIGDLVDELLIDN